MKSFFTMLALSFSLVSLAATKAEMKFAIEATDLESVSSVKVAMDQLAMAGTLTLDLVGVNGDELYDQRIIIYDGESPELKDKFPLVKREDQGYDVGESEVHPDECVTNADSMTDEEYIAKCGQ